jgi:hypothetical protein
MILKNFSIENVDEVNADPNRKIKKYLKGTLVVRLNASIKILKMFYYCMGKKKNFDFMHTFSLKEMFKENCKLDN